MADNKSISTYLISANAKGYLKPSSEKDICLIDSINSANLILFWLSKAGDNGLNTEQLSQKVKMHENTCKIFCRELVRLKKVIREQKKTIVIWRINPMIIKEAMAQASQHNGTTGIFYNPSNMDAVFAEHGQEPEGYLIWCDCSRVVEKIRYYGGIDEAYEKINQ